MAQQASQGQSGDNSTAPIWVTVFAFIAVFIAWKLGHRQVVSAVFFINIIQIKLIGLFITSSELTQDLYLMQTLDPGSVDWKELVEITGRVGNYIRYPVIAILLVMAVVLYKSDITLKYRRVHSMKTLRAQEQDNWPAIMPVVKQNLAEVDINTGPWAMALTPMEFARKHQLLKRADALMDNPLPGQEMTAGVRRGDAKRVFTLQLGPVWDGFDRSPPHVRALAAVFMARMNRDKDAAFAILKSLDQGTSRGKPDYSVATKVLNKYVNTPLVQAVLNQHAYLLTMMASLLKASRDDGVMPSADFLWLKPVDRRLWYMLNSVGRQTPFSEVGGPFAHWRAECVMGRRSLIPMIDEAIKALEIAIKDIKLTHEQLQRLEP
jgi:intracellular multiplication protein IcmP